MRQKNWLGAQGQHPLVKLCRHGQEKEVTASWLLALSSLYVKAQLALQFVVIKRARLRPISLLFFWATPLRWPLCVFSGESHSRLEGGSLPLYSHDTWAHAEIKSLQCHPVQMGTVPLSLLHGAHQSEDKSECKSGGLDQTVATPQLNSLSCHCTEHFCPGALADLKPCRNEGWCL